MGKRIIIVGGGFGGVQCARRLCRAGAGERLEVVLFNQENHLVFSPLLAEAVGSSLNPMDVVVPLRQLLPGAFCRTEEVRRADLEGKQVEYVDDCGRSAVMGYDHLVLACGSVTNLNVVPGMADHGFPLKTVSDANRLRSKVMEEMEKAEVAADAERRRWHLTFLVVGGGYSGVEAAGEINDLVRASARYFRNWTAADTRVVLVHSRDQLLPEISSNLRDFAQRKMRRAGIEMVLPARVERATAEGVVLADGRFLSGGTIVCTVGSSPAPIVEALPLPKTKGRLNTNPDMSLPGPEGVWAVGDCANIINARDGQPSPTTGQFAERQGRQCAENILRVLRGLPTRPFAFKQLGELCSIGGHSAVAELFGLRLSGFVAWFVWRGVYLFKLPSIGRKVQVGFDWAWLLLFPRDLAHIRARETDRVSHAHYRPGDYIFRQGETPTNFYVLEQGEVEVLRDGNGSDGEVMAVLGAGSFFGEKALLNDRPRVMSVRARTPVEVLVMGKEVFTQVSGALQPLREALARALNRRAVDAWEGHPEAHELLWATPVKDLVEPVPTPLLKPDLTLREAGRLFVDCGNEFFFVSADDRTLDGVLTITDFVRDRGRALRGNTPVRELMTPHPITVALDDNAAVALGAMREYRLKTLPVIDRASGNTLAGCLRIRRLMAFVLSQTPANPPSHAE